MVVGPPWETSPPSSTSTFSMFMSTSVLLSTIHNVRPLQLPGPRRTITSLRPRVLEHPRRAEAQVALWREETLLPDWQW